MDRPIKELVIIGLTVLVVVLLTYQSSDYFNRSIMDMLLGVTGWSGTDAENYVASEKGWTKNTKAADGGHVPDFWIGNDIYEVKWNKGTSSLEWTSQLEDFYQTAKKNGGSFTIIVPSNFDINGTDPSFQNAYNAKKFSLDKSILPSKDD
jgi:hypothetical protein